MEIDHSGVIWPFKTVEWLCPIIHRIRFEYDNDSFEVVFEQIFTNVNARLTRRCFWANERDRAVLKWEAAGLGLNLKRVKDLDVLSGLYGSACCVLLAQDTEGKPNALVFPDLLKFGIDY